MKALITERQAKELGAFSFWYYEIQELLTYESPIYYTSWIYGRKADFYKIEDPETLERYRISTWYWPTGKSTNYELTRETEQKARKISMYSYHTKKRLYRKLLIRIIKGS